MPEQFIDRILNCVDCHGEFIFTAGEQLFFFDKQFKNDPKRCKPCKSRRSGLSAAANGAGPAPAGLSRTETRTLCSDCGIETTVPFKPTQGRPVLCRQCFQMKTRAAALRTTPESGAAALTQASITAEGSLSPHAAVLAAASMSAASPQSSVATAADLASITQIHSTVLPQGSAQRTAQLIAEVPAEALSSDKPAQMVVAEAPNRLP